MLREHFGAILSYSIDILDSVVSVTGVPLYNYEATDHDGKQGLTKC